MNRAAAIAWARRLNRAHLYARVAEARDAADYWLVENPDQVYYLQWCGPLPRRSDWELASWNPNDAFARQAKSLQ